MICLLSAGKTAVFAASAFTLSWTHSVEKTAWRESWTAGPEGLTVVEGRIEGSGAGMEPPPDAVLKGGVYVYTPTLPPIRELVLAASGATGAGWTFCPQGDGCLTLGADPGAPQRLSWCRAAPGEKAGAAAPSPGRGEGAGLVR